MVLPVKSGWACAHCKKVYTSSAEAARHHEYYLCDKNPRGVRFTCKPCNRSFAGPTAYNRHLKSRRHTKSCGTLAHVWHCYYGTAGLNSIDRKYNLVYADPPWRYRGGGSGAAENHYNCLSIEEMSLLPVSSIAADTSVLAMWVTGPMMSSGIHLMEKWGFSYKTVLFVWAKKTEAGSDVCGMGHYSRPSCEYVLLGTRGMGESNLVTDHAIPQLVSCKKTNHSAKPEEVRGRLERLFAKCDRKIELFARKSVVGWDRWGAEAPADEREGPPLIIKLKLNPNN